MTRWIILIVVVLAVEFYAFQAIKNAFRIKWVAYGYEIISVLALLFVIWTFTQFDRHEGQTKLTLYSASILLILTIPKIILTLVLFGEDLVRLFNTVVHYFMHQESLEGHMPDRRRFVSQIALGLAAVPFFSLIYGVLKGKYDYRVIKQAVFFEDLPDSFDGFTITHISDMHSGSLDNPEKIQYAVDLINEQNSDLVVFTGDIVNSLASEMTPWIDTFKGIHDAPFGKFSILGNHDYGEYIIFDTNEEKVANFEAIKGLHEKIGFELLLNENRILKRGEDSIALVGVENWGHRFRKAGDLTVASEGLKASDFKVLLSHDPSHWEMEVKKDPRKYHLTLAGHTHGFQFGIEIPGIIKWSPVSYVYKQWAGLYEHMDRFIYVNRGLGFHGYSGRVGIWPEITVLKLKKKQKIS